MTDDKKNTDKNEIVRLDLTDNPRTIVKYKTGEDSDELFGYIKNYPAVKSDVVMFIMANALMNGQKQIVFSPKQLQSFIGYRQAASNKDFREAIHTIFKDVSTLGYETEEIDKEGHHHTIFRPFFSKTDIDTTTNTVTVQLGERAAQIFNDFSKTTQFNRFSLLQYFQINSKYSKNLFRLLKEKRVWGHRSFLADELRDKLSIPASYKPADINRRIIKRAFIDLMPYFRNFSYEIVNSRSSEPTKYVFTWDKEKRRQRDSFSDPNIPKLNACSNILTNQLATDDEKCTAMDRYFRLTRGKYKKLQEKDPFAFLKLIYTDDTNDELIRDAKKTDPKVLEFLISRYKELQVNDKLTSTGLTTLTLLEAEAEKRRKQEAKFNDGLDLDGIPQNFEIDPIWKDDPAYTVLSATKRLKPLEMYDKDTLGKILQKYVQAVSSNPTDKKLLQDIGVITAYLQKLH